MMFLAPFALAACIALPAGAGDVTAADLVPAFSALAAAPPETVLSYAPEPGLERVFHLPELRRIAAQFHLTPPEDEICVKRTVAPLENAALLAAMQKEMPGAKIGILEISRQPAPPGEITFRRTGLRANTATGAIWFGAIRYAPNRDFTIWARVNVTAPVVRLVARHEIAAGQRLEAGDVSAETRDEFPGTQATLTSADVVAGKSSRVPIHAGAPLRPEMLENCKDVRAGEIVAVDVVDGGAHLTLEARAEGSGSAGESIAVLNPMSGKRFMAKIQGRGRVLVGGAPEENQ